MIIRVTNQCLMGCSHCMISGSSPTGEHMERGKFRKALYLAADLGIQVLLISGGEPFNHPDIDDLISSINVTAGLLGTRFQVVVASNGMFLEDEDRYKRAMALKVLIQVTRDPRFYPIPLSEAAMDRILGSNPENLVMETHIQSITPCDRTLAAGIGTNRISPMCFNLRSVTRAKGIHLALSFLQQSGRVCTPSVDVDGTIRAGEADTCAIIGNVDSGASEIERNLKRMKCRKCAMINTMVNGKDPRLVAIED